MSALIFVGVFLALVFVTGLIGFVGLWELITIAAVAVLLTVVIARSGGRRRAPNRAAS
jgi:hypothetical protein